MKSRTIYALLLTFALAAPAHSNPTPNPLAVPKDDANTPGAGPISGGKMFNSLWFRLRKSWATRVEQDKGAITFLGDSITMGWSPSFRGAFKGYKTANRGISADTSRGALYRMDGDVLALDPAAIVILIGVNDLGRDTEPEIVAGNVKLMLDKIKAHNDKTPVILCYIMPSAPNRNVPKEKAQKLNNMYAGFAKKYPQVTTLDTWTLFADENGGPKKGILKDGIHPNSKGYFLWRGALLNKFAELKLEKIQPAKKPKQ
ncbi:acetylhydrolase IB subunit gamma [Oceaniferula spumae]|uniref:Acetylhydrolase IB subunit gamma n=1 Tax=Oceaniferula spumae TaxID=2979115 RepID=A0AAT9FM25_9BACT